MIDSSVDKIGTFSLRGDGLWSFVADEGVTDDEVAAVRGTIDSLLAVRNGYIENRFSGGDGGTFESTEDPSFLFFSGRIDALYPQSASALEKLRTLLVQGFSVLLPGAQVSEIQKMKILSPGQVMTVLQGLGELTSGPEVTDLQGVKVVGSGKDITFLQEIGEVANG